MELSVKVKEQIDLLLPQSEKQLAYLQATDWVNIEEVKKRDKILTRILLLSSTNINSAIKLYNLAGEESSHPLVKKALEIMVGAYYILEDGYIEITEKYNWMEYPSENEQDEAKIRDEIDFQAELLRSLSALREKLRTINFGDVDSSINISIHNNTPIPLIMRERLEERYPEILEKLKEDEG